MARSLEGASYLQKWLVVGSLIGAIAGVGAIVFYEALVLATHLFLGVLAGYRVPTPIGEGNTPASGAFAHPWAIPLIVALGGLLSGALVFSVAPEAEGHGTDAAIDAVHHHPRGIRFRAVLVKIVASAITIGSGGSGGREGPTGQISAGFGSLLSRVLDLSPADARIAVSAGIGSGIGAIFGAPLGGAVLSAEIVYRDDFEMAALLPSFIASIIGYSIFSAVEGFTPLFGFHTSLRFTHASQLLWYGLIGIVGGFVGLLYAKGFYGIAALSKRIPIPRWTKPAVGGLLVGSIALAIPQVLGTGYGWIQASLGHQLLSIPLWIVLVLPVARILATGLSIGTGGSGGIFGPGMVIGAFVGAAVWRLFEPVVPSLGHDPAPYVIVGMMCCFGSISRAPLAVMLMVAEMTGSLSLLAPAMIAVGIAWFIVRRGDDTIYRSQLKSRSEAPAQRLLVGMPLLANVAVRDAMAHPRVVLGDDVSQAEARRLLTEAGVNGAPVMDGEGSYLGVVAVSDLASVPEPVGGLVDAHVPTVSDSAHLDAALDALATSPDTWIPVLDPMHRVVGTLADSDVVRGYRMGLRAALGHVGAADVDSGSRQVQVGAGSPLVDLTLREAPLPAGILVTLIRRGKSSIEPDGETRIRTGDELVLVCREEDQEELARLAGGDGGPIEALDRLEPS
jgi:H+/Cl- antiporter ClcA